MSDNNFKEALLTLGWKYWFRLDYMSEITMRYNQVCGGEYFGRSISLGDFLEDRTCSNEDKRMIREFAVWIRVRDPNKTSIKKFSKFCSDSKALFAITPEALPTLVGLDSNLQKEPFRRYMLPYTLRRCVTGLGLSRDRLMTALCNANLKNSVFYRVLDHFDTPPFYYNLGQLENVFRKDFHMRKILEFDYYNLSQDDLIKTQLIFEDKIRQNNYRTRDIEKKSLHLTQIKVSYN